MRREKEQLTVRTEHDSKIHVRVNVLPRNDIYQGNHLLNPLLHNGNICSLIVKILIL